MRADDNGRRQRNPAVFVGEDPFLTLSHIQ